MFGTYEVNAQIVCDYSSSSVTFNIGTTASLPQNALTKYLLVDHTTNAIVQISTSPSFSGIVQSKVYDVYAFSYVNDNTVTGLTVGSPLSAVTASCSDFSNPLTVRICPPTNSGQCDFTTSSFTVKTQTTPPTNGTTQYILADLTGTILQINSVPTFSGLSGSNTYNVLAISYTESVSNLIIGGNYNNITGNCFDLSNPLPVSVCVCKPICLSVTTVKIK
ncbi:hypothetical protein Emtol_3016 [Emticicia oligotrophica DSM 17448]|uniref:Uncharacterized protein n=2 Tax=Emticicia TaxID=312278 RepID=A0ABN4APP0_EMTOG|nr:hypothetical protein Emtol_3016 [Emticicia oligotrophica DSM 17448]